VEADIGLRVHGEAALKELDQLQMQASIEMNKNLQQVTQHLVDMRNELIEAGTCRAGPTFDDRLTAINAILSCLFGIEFARSGLEWQRICEGREALRNLLKGS
jgi:hypothetical protein